MVVGPYGEGRENQGLLSWNPLHVPPPVRNLPRLEQNPEEHAQWIKDVSRRFGATRVGIAHLNRDWVYGRVQVNPYSPDAPVTKEIEFGEATSPQETEARRILDAQADRFIDEVRGSVNFYLSQAEDVELSRIIVSGNGARLPHLANRLGDTLGARIEPARVIEGLNTGKLSEAEISAMQPVIPIPVGLALWEG